MKSPDDAQVDEFILSGGKLSSKEVSKPVVPTTKMVSPKSLFERFETVLPPGSLEDSFPSFILAKFPRPIAAKGKTKCKSRQIRG